MKKVVINTCYGGFGLSLKAQELLLKLKGKEFFLYDQTCHYHRDGKDEYTLIDGYEDGVFRKVSTMFLGNIIDKEQMEKAYKDNHIVSFYDIDRCDADLIKVIEELGDEANTQCSKLSIVEIPEDVEYEIDEYDGFESVEEVHRSWS